MYGDARVGLVGLASKLVAQHKAALIHLGREQVRRLALNHRLLSGATSQSVAALAIFVGPNHPLHAQDTHIEARQKEVCVEYTQRGARGVRTFAMSPSLIPEPRNTMVWGMSTRRWEPLSLRMRCTEVTWCTAMVTEGNRIHDPELPNLFVVRSGRGAVQSMSVSSHQAATQPVTRE